MCGERVWEAQMVFFSDVSSEAVKLSDRADCGQTPAGSRQFTPHQIFISLSCCCWWRFIFQVHFSPSDPLLTPLSFICLSSSLCAYLEQHWFFSSPKCFFFPSFGITFLLILNIHTKLPFNYYLCIHPIQVTFCQHRCSGEGFQERLT